MEKKDIPFNLYIGQPVKVWLEDENGKFTIEREGTLSWDHEEGHEWVIYHLLSTDPLDFDGWDFRFKLLLRPLSSMTEDEEKHMISTQDTVKLDGYPQIVLKADSGETFRWMLSQGFDLFGLIESGIAIDSTLKPV